MGQWKGPAEVTQPASGWYQMGPCRSPWRTQKQAQRPVHTGGGECRSGV